MRQNDTTPTRAGTTDPPIGANHLHRKEHDTAPLERGTSIGGRYIVLEELGRGGMAIVYRAYDPELDRHLALKVILHRDVEGHASERLLREAQALAQLSHPHVVAVYDDAGRPSMSSAISCVQGERQRRSILRATIVAIKEANASSSLFHLRGGPTCS